MKMQHVISAPTAGTLTALQVTEGQQVEMGTLLAIVQESDPEARGTARPATHGAAPKEPQ
jgi:propionyl-CoA carboxylase alpha chain